MWNLLLFFTDNGKKNSVFSENLFEQSKQFAQQCVITASQEHSERRDNTEQDTQEGQPDLPSVFTQVFRHAASRTDAEDGTHRKRTVPP